MTSKQSAPAAASSAAKPGTPAVDSGDWIALALIAALAVYVRWSWTAGLPAILHPDSDSYFEIAQRLWRGGGFGDLSRRTPLYPLLLWITGKSSASGFDRTLLVQHALGVGTALLTYLTTRGVIRYRVPALFAGLVAAAAPGFVLAEHSILSEPLYTFLLAAAGWFLVRHLATADEDRRGAVLPGVLCGAALGLACLTRPAGALLLPLWLVLLLPLRGTRAAWRFALTAGIAWLALLLPLLIRNQQAVGSFSLTQSTGRNLISVTDLRVDYAAAEHKDVLSIYHRYLPNKRGSDAVIVYSALPELRRETKLSDVEIDRALAAAAERAILLHPLDYLRDRLQRVPLLFGDPMNSQWYALYRETYVPLIEFTGKQNPEMTSRTVLNHPLKDIDFPHAAASLEHWYFGFGSPWFLVLAGLGLLGTLLKFSRKFLAGLGMTAPTKGYRQSAGLLICAAVAASLLAAILMQPPNLRYRLPTLPWEILLAAAGLALAGDLANRLMQLLNRKIGRDIPCWIANVAVCAAAVVLFIAAQRVPGESAVKVGDFVDSANQPEDGPAIIRQMPLAGKTVPMIYWRTDMPARRTIRTDAAVASGGRHHLRMAYSCGEAACADGRLKLVSFNALGTGLGTQELPLARERTDNDRFWEQLDEPVALPTGTARVRVEISFEPGAGSLVIPFISLTN